MGCVCRIHKRSRSFLSRPWWLQSVVRCVQSIPCIVTPSSSPFHHLPSCCLNGSGQDLLCMGVGLSRPHHHHPLWLVHPTWPWTACPIPTRTSTHDACANEGGVARASRERREVAWTFEGLRGRAWKRAARDLRHTSVETRWRPTPGGTSRDPPPRPATGSDRGGGDWTPSSSARWARWHGSCSGT